MDQKEFLRQMEDLADYGRTKQNKLTKDEISDYCSDLELTEEHLKLVYAYLAEKQIYVEGCSDKHPSEVLKGPERDREATSADSKYLRFYRKELKSLPMRTPEEMEELFCQLQHGEESAVPAVIEAHLGRVVTLAGKYRGRGVLLEDLIQEGNLELITCVSMLLGNREVVDCRKAIDHAVRSRLIELVDEELAGNDQISTVLAKVNLLLESTHVLAEEYGRIATIQELAEFTHMNPQEIQMYVDLSLNNIELGTGEKNEYD